MNNQDDNVVAKLVEVYNALEQRYAESETFRVMCRDTRLGRAIAAVRRYRGKDK